MTTRSSPKPKVSRRKLAMVTLLGFSSGFPLALTGTLLQAWMTDLKIDLGTIGLFTLVGLPYGFKFLWSPLIDRYSIPLLGRRRGWILVTQLALVVFIAGIALSTPGVTPGLTALVALITTFFSATQDIVIDAYRTEVLEPDELGPGAALNVTGYRLAMIATGAGALALADRIPYQAVYLLMAAAMSLGVLVTLLAPEPTHPGRAPKTLSDAVVQPFVEFFKRRGVWEVVLFLIFYKLDVVMTIALQTSFFLQIGFTKTEIATVVKSFGLVATIFGTLAGGALMPKLGMLRSLWIFGIVQGVSNIMFAVQAHVGHSYPVLVSAITLENFCSGMGNSAYLAFLMSICDKRFTATQFALLSSLMAQARVLGGAPTGYMVEQMGWELFFCFTTAMMIPGLLLLTRYNRWAKPSQAK